MSHVDSPSPVTHVSLCAGYGGIDLGLRRAIPTLRTIAVSEIEAFACANLVAKMEAGLLDSAPIWTDLKTFPWSDFRDRVDILSGGYPCQPFSAAGKRLGAEDPRHLWPHISGGIALMRPAVCFFENVEGHISLGLRDVLQDLAGLGYRATWCVASASECGAPHQRKRVFILAYDGNNAGAHFWSRFIDRRGGWQAANISSQAPDQQAWADRSEEWRQELSSNAGISSGWCAELADSQCAGLEGQHNRNAPTEPPEHVGADAWASGERGAWPSRPGEQQLAWEPPRVVVNADAVAARRVSRILGSPQSEEQGEGIQRQRTGHAAGYAGQDTWPSRPSEPQHGWEPPRVVGNFEAMGNASQREDNGRESKDLGQEAGEGRCGNYAADCTGEVLGNADSPRPQERAGQRGARIQGADADGGEDAERQTQPPMGRDADGPADWLDHAELYTSCDNRTDELRLLGNGVVPACAERAFRLLVGELMEHQP